MMPEPREAPAPPDLVDALHALYLRATAARAAAEAACAVSRQWEALFAEGPDAPEDWAG